MNKVVLESEILFLQELESHDVTQQYVDSSNGREGVWTMCCLSNDFIPLN